MTNEVTKINFTNQVAARFGVTPQKQDASYNVSDFYHKTSQGFGYIKQTGVNQFVIDFLKSQGKSMETSTITCSEHLVYGLLHAVRNNDKEMFNSLFKSVVYLSTMNYKETNTIMLLPWLVEVTQDPTVPFVIMKDEKNFQNRFFGNASAADADLDLIVALIMAIQKGWGDDSMKNFVYLYAKDFLDQVVKSYDIKNNGAIERFYMISKGGLVPSQLESINISITDLNKRFSDNGQFSAEEQKLIIDSLFYKENDLLILKSNPQSILSKLSLTEDKKKFIVSLLEERQEAQKTWTEFCPTYPNIKYLEFIAEYFKPDRAWKKIGSVSFYEHFNNLKDDTVKLMDSLKSYMRPSLGTGEYFARNFPESVQVTSDGNKIIFRNPTVSSAADNARLFWRTNDQTFNVGYPTEKGGSYYTLLESVLNITNPNRITPIKTYFSLEDGDTSKYRFINEIGKHYGISNQDISRFMAWISDYDNTYLIEERDISPYPSNLSARYSRQTSGINNDFRYAIELSKSRTTVDKGIQVYEEILSKLLDKEEVEEIFISSLWARPASAVQEKAPDNASAYLNGKVSEEILIECVSNYVGTLQKMKGFSSKDIKRTLNRLISLADNKENTKNAVLRSLYLEKILLWNILDPQERKFLEEEIAPKFKLTDVLGFVKSKFENINAVYQYNPFKMQAIGRHYISFKLKVNEITLDSEEKVGEEYKLKVRDIGSLHISESLKFILLEEVIKRDLINIFKQDEIFSTLKEYISNLPEEFQMMVFLIAVYSKKFNFEQKTELIHDALNRLKKASPKKYMENYLAIFQAYQLMLFEGSRDSGNSFEKKVEWLEKLYNLNTLLVNKPITNSYEDKTLEKLNNLFNPRLFEVFIKHSPQVYSALVSQTTSLLYWTNYSLRKEGSNPEMQKKIEELLNQVVDNFKNIFSNDAWKFEPRFAAIYYRMEAEKLNENSSSLSDSEIAEIIKHLDYLVNYSRQERKDDAYVELLFTEIVFKLGFAGASDRIGLKDRLLEVLNDPIFGIETLEGKKVFEHIYFYMKPIILDNIAR